MQRAEVAKRKSTAERSVNYLVIGYNHCAFTVQGTHPEYLSIPLIKFASQEEYEGFYACTHRCFQLLAKQSQDIAAGKIQSTPGTPDCTYPCYKITVSFVKATCIPNEATSTLDDVKFKTAGEAYPKILYKMEHKDQPDLTKFADWNDINQFGRNKNYQLLQVAKHAAAKNAEDTEITLTFVDDKKTVCEDAKKLLDHPEWPKNVRLNIYRHEAVSDVAPVELIAEGLLKNNSLFPAKRPVTRSMTQDKRSYHPS